MCKFLSKSGGVPFQISFFLGDLTRNDPNWICDTRMSAKSQAGIECTSTL